MPLFPPLGTFLESPAWLPVAGWGYWISLAFVVYTMIGYPAALALLARRTPESPPDRMELVTVSIILCVRNGERWIRGKLDSIGRLDYPKKLIECIVVSDGSTDRTEEIVAEYPDVRLLVLPAGGKPKALNAGMAVAQGEILFFTDVRQELAPDSLRNMAARFGDRGVGVVSGELMIRTGQGDKEPGLYWRYEKWIRCNLSRIGRLTGATGAIYAVRKALARPIPEKILADDIYLPLSIALRGHRIYLDTTAKAFDDPVTIEAEFRRKVRTLAGVYQIAAAFPELLLPWHRLGLHFLSHKLTRMVLPYFILLFALSNLVMSGWLAMATLAAQVLAYSLALVDLWIPVSWKIKRLSAPVRSMVVMLTAAVCAVSVWFVPSENLWHNKKA